MTDFTPQPEFSHAFPAIRGVQARKEYYVAMMPLKHVTWLIKLDRTDVPVECRAQRYLNKGRIPAIKRYLLQNKSSYVLSSLTASIGGVAKFEPLADDAIGQRLGRLHISADTPVVINDGQHRRAAIEAALEEEPDLGRETVSVVLFVDVGLKRSQQRFADLNRHVVRPTKSISILYDHRDEMSRLVNRIVKEIPAFADTTETAKTTISNRSRKLFTLSGFYSATRALLGEDCKDGVQAEHESFAIRFWSCVSNVFSEWQLAASGELHPADLRANYIHSHGVALQAIAIAGRELVSTNPTTWQKDLEKLADINWSRSNTDLWEGRAMVNGKISKSRDSINRTAEFIKSRIIETPNEKAYS